MSATPRTKLKTAATLIASGHPDLLAQLINIGLNGNKVVKAEVVDGDLWIARRYTPQHEFTRDVRITATGKLECETPGKKLAAILNNAISINTLATIEAQREGVPAIEGMMRMAEGVQATLRDAKNKQRMTKLTLGSTLEGSAEALRDIVKVIDPQVIVDRMNTVGHADIRFRKTDTEIVMETTDEVPLARVTLSAGQGATVANGHVAEYALNSVLNAAVLELDAEINLAGKLKAHRKAEQDAMEQRWAEARRERDAKRREHAQSLIDSIRVPAGQVFTVNVPTYWEDAGCDIDIKTVMIAEKDLDARDYLKILEGRPEGLATVTEMPQFMGGSEMLRQLRNAVALMDASQDNDLSPA